MRKMLLSLCIVYLQPKILLGMKKRGFGVGRWNGFGGKLESDETVEESAIRELKEESGVEAVDMFKNGMINFAFESNEEVLEVHIFSVNSFKGEPIETEEMRPEWFPVDEIPYGNMWTSDKYWLPLLLEGKKFRGNFLFDRPSDKEYSAKIIKHELIEVDEIYYERN